jgi:hypothetical protein
VKNQVLGLQPDQDSQLPDACHIRIGFATSSIMKCNQPILFVVRLLGKQAAQLIISTLGQAVVQSKHLLRQSW